MQACHVQGISKMISEAEREVGRVVGDEVREEEGDGDTWLLWLSG